VTAYAVRPVAEGRTDPSPVAGQKKPVGRHIKVRSREDAEFDCYLALPDGTDTVPAVVLASAVHGVDQDVRGVADEFASHGYIAAAPDLFWRSIPGPLARDDKRAAERSQPRLEKIKAGEADMADTLAELKKVSRFNGRAASMGFCYGGPYAILGPRRLGYEAGISCHGTRLLDFIGELEAVARPVCIIWGDRDQQAPPPVLDAYRALSRRMKNVELHIFPGVEHGYMFPGNAKAYSQSTRDFSMRRARAILDALR
jgi:carboxymethylenebutenolidase